MNGGERSLLGTLSYYLNPFHSERYVLRSSVSVGDCIFRLREAIRSGAHVGGNETFGTFTLYKKKSYSNAFQTLATVRFMTGADGTRLFLKLGPWFPVALFVTVTLFVSPLLVAAFWWACRAFPGACELRGWSLGQCALTYVAVVAIILLGRWLARSEGTYFLGFLKSALSAEDFPRQP
jgi:hypothetical protein